MAASSAPTRTNFWLEFRVFDDGLDAAAARRMTAASINGGGSATFLLFPQLPAELRLKIWEYLLAPRIVQVSCFDSEDSSSESEFESGSESASASPSLSCREEEGAEEGGVNTYFSSFSSSVAATSSARERRHGKGKGRRREERWQSQQQVPVLLHVNRETRTLALKHYELAFAWKVPHVLAVNSLVPGTYYYPQNHFPPSSSAAASTTNNTSPPSLSSPSTSTTSPTPSQTQKPPPPQPQPKPTRRTATAGSEARVYFNFTQDLLYLRGELEPRDSFGFNSPMAYFVARGDAARVRRVAVAFRALGYGETGSQQIFGSLFHVVDRFGQGPPPVPLPSPGMGTGTTGKVGGGAQEVGFYGQHHQNHHGGWNQDRDRDQKQQGNRGDKHHGLIGGRVLIAVDPADEHTHALLGGEGPLVPSSPSSSQDQGLYNNNNNNNIIGATQNNNFETGIEVGEATTSSDTNGGTEQKEEKEPNVVQKIWRDWYRGSIVTSSLAKMKFTLVREEDLGRYL